MENRRPGTLFHLLLPYIACSFSFPRDLNLSFVVCLSVKLCPVPCAWLPPLGSPVVLHPSEVNGSSATSSGIHTIFTSIQHFYLVWLCFCQLLVLCVCHLSFSQACCVPALTIWNGTTSRYRAGVQPKPKSTKKQPGKGGLGIKGLPHLHLFISGF